MNENEMTLPRKQNSSQEDWLLALNDDYSETVHLEKLISGSVQRITSVTSGKRCAFGWSAGKDSLVLEQICYLAGIRDCVFAMTNLEYPEFLSWVVDHMPHELEVVNNGWDLEWLASHRSMLFPENSDIAAKWFAGVQHRGQAEYAKKHDLDVLILGRRRSDGNYCGKNGYYAKNGIARFSPLHDWSHEDVLAAIQFWKLDLPPNYFWPRGFRVGTGSWPARQWCKSIEHGWSEVYEIDPTIVKEASEYLDSAKDFLCVASSDS